MAPRHGGAAAGRRWGRWLGGRGEHHHESEREKETRRLRGPAPSGGAMNWYVLQTNRNKERLAQLALGQRGVRTYLPRLVQWPAPAVGSAIAPLFPGYLFVCLALDDCGRVCWLPGVRAFVNFGGGPATIDASAIEFLREREGADGLIRCEPHPTL